MKRIAYISSAGAVCVVNPAISAMNADESEEEFLARISAKDVPADAREVRIIEGDAIPQDRTFRAAWKIDASAVSVDMDKARELQRQRLRSARAPILDSLDADYLAADEKGDQQGKRTIAAKKQALRDITRHPEIEAASTPEELKIAGLSILGK